MLNGQLALRDLVQAHAWLSAAHVTARQGKARQAHLELEHAGAIEAAAAVVATATQRARLLPVMLGHVVWGWHAHPWPGGELLAVAIGRSGLLRLTLERKRRHHVRWWKQLNAHKELSSRFEC